MSRASRTAPSARRVRPCGGVGWLLQHRQPQHGQPPDTTADSGLSDPDTTTETLPETTDTTQAEELDLKLGDTAEYTDGVRMTVLGLQRDVQPSCRELFTNPKAKVLAVTVKIVNGSSKSFDLSVTLNLVYGQDGREAEAYFDSAKGINGIDSPSRLRPKRAVTGKFAFEVPASNVKELLFEGAPGFDYDAQQWTA
jgi:hypothetical protein